MKSTILAVMLLFGVSFIALAQDRQTSLSDLIEHLKTESEANCAKDNCIGGGEEHLKASDSIFENSQTFGALSSLVGSRLRGTPTDGSTERAADIQKWEWALGGTAILIRHALEDGSYGGNTYVYKDAASGELVYVYITNAGFRTEGVILLNDDGVGYTAEEDVAGHPTITKVRSTSVINEDGSSRMTSEYLDGGNWVPGHAFNYVPTEKPLPKLIPKPAEVEMP